MNEGARPIDKKTFEEVLAENGFLCWKTVGVSMRPLLREGKDIVTIKRLEAPPRKYDVVLFRRPGVTGRGAYVLHRILKTNPDGSFWIIGDNCREGETVCSENILGVLTSILRNGKTITPETPLYRLYVHLWWDFYPLRRALVRCVRFPGSVLKIAGKQHQAKVGKK